MSVEDNKATIVRYLRGVEAMDLDTVRDCFAADAIQHFPQPGDYSYADADPDAEPGTQVGRDKIIDGFRIHIPLIYYPETIRMDIKHVMGEGDHVSAWWILSAKTRKGDRDYANHYHFLFRMKDGLIAEYWEFCDTAYGREMLY